jgi:hypothetical protein
VVEGVGVVVICWGGSNRNKRGVLSVRVEG